LNVLIAVPPLLAVLAACCSAAEPAPQPAAPPPAFVAAARALVDRVLPGRSKDFALSAIPAGGAADVFEIESDGPRVVLRGSSGVALSAGLGWYLTHVARCRPSLWGDPPPLPDPRRRASTTAGGTLPPPVSAKIRRTCPYPWRYCLNYCAFSYTLAWWDWPQWERFIDWMALEGITMPLAVTGQEAVWRDVGRGLGLEEKEIAEFLVGPGYLPFGWMGCIDGWCGPLPPSWIDRHAELGRKIVDRERELGMRPVLQGFTGHVPPAIARAFPGARLRQLRSWCGFPGTSFLDPADPLFEKVGKAFVEEQTRRFGTDHLYASDTFIEMSPPSDDPAFLDAMGKSIHRAMAAADPEAVWVLQGWLFVNNPKFWKEPQRKAFLGSVPADRLVVLDLFCESKPTWSITEAFDGKPWVFCIIHSFGDQVSLHGGLPQIAGNLRAAIESPRRGRLSGVGLIMEGLSYNPAVWDFVMEAAWREAVPEPAEWLEAWAAGRYGKLPAPARDAWRLIFRSAYSRPGQSRAVICARPSLKVKKSGPDPEVAEAWGKLLEASGDLGGVDAFRFDLVHVAREALSGLGGTYAGDVLAAGAARDRKALDEAGRRLVGLLQDLDDLVGTRPEFLLGRWLEDAKRWAASDAERRLLERNARTLITLWGPKDSGLNEYSQRQWSGMVRGFYLPRWELLLRRLEESVASGTPLDEGRFEADLRTWEEGWTHGSESYPTSPRGEAVGVARRLWEKYRGVVGIEPDAPSLTTGKPVSCSWSLPPHPAERANDGRTLSTDRYWATDVGRDPAAWWQVDLEKPVAVGRVVVVTYYGDRRYYGFTVEGSLDGKSWETLADRKDNREPATRAGTTCEFPARPVRFLRVRMISSSANTGRHLVEVEAFEK
jgi:alpha-N-acetylglucosaminidase